jgi:RNA polymerase sigma factor for flagellar operon FliA
VARPPVHPRVAQLVARHLPHARAAAALVYRRMRGNAAFDAAFDDLLALAHAGLVEAAERYDPDLGTDLGTNLSTDLGTDLGADLGANLGANLGASFATFAWYRIHGAMLDGLRRSAANERARGLPIDALRAAGLAAAAEPSPLPPDDLDQARARAQVRAAVARLPDAPRAIVTKHYFEGKTLVAAGAELGLSKSWACRLHARAVSQLRALLDAERDA